MVVRRAHPGWGADRIGYQLSREGVVSVPGRRVSIGRWCGTGWWCRGSGSGGGLIIGGGSGAGRWSCGRWMWLAGSTWPMASS